VDRAETTTTKEHLASLFRFRLTGSSAVARYTFAMLFGAAALLLQVSLHQRIGGFAYFFLYPAVFTIGAVAGFGPALLIILLGGWGADFLFIEPRFESKLDSLEGVIRYLMFISIGIGTSGLLRWNQLAEQRLAEHLAVVRHGEEEFRLMANSAPVLAWIANTQKLYTWFNQGWLKFTGRSSEQECGRGWMDGIHPDDLQEWRETFDLNFDRRREFSIEYRLRHHSGEYRWVLDTGVPRFNRDGVFEGFIGACIDIHNQKLAQEHSQSLLVDLEQAKNRFEAVANNIPQLAWMTAADGALLWYNQQWFDYTGVTLEQMQDLGGSKVHHSEHSERVTEKWQRHLRSGEDWEDTFPLRRADGEYRWFLSRARPIRDRKGQITSWFGSNTDIEEQRTLIQELAIAVRARDEFLSIASHELKTPLTSLKLKAQMLKRSIEKKDPKACDPERVLSMAVQTDKQVSRLTRLVDDMLDVSRIRSGSLKIEREKFDLCELIDDVVEHLKDHFTSASCGQPVVEKCDGAIGDWDRLRIEQVISNLLTNAIRYGNGGIVHVQVEVKNGQACLSVRDEGIGIAEGAQEKIFNRFERAINASEVSGLGLGLFITKQIIDAHGGKISVISKLGEGATFLVELPLGDL